MLDIHCHGGFGIDLMVATPTELDTLAQKLFARGVAAFCPTTLTTDFDALCETAQRLGAWVNACRKAPRPRSALPIGLHLEGPFLSPKACGAHPPKALKPFTAEAMTTLWTVSQHTIKIMTIAAELLSAQDLKWVTAFARKNQIVLSLGHSTATEAEARRAFQAGFTNITHAWNAMPFQHRAPGVLGAALGNPSVFAELICDQIHVSPTVMDWTLALHPHDRVCLISDCAPCAACAAEKIATFGPLYVQNQDGAARIVTPDGKSTGPVGQPAPLAGAGELLPELFRRWAKARAKRLKKPLRAVIKESYPWVSSVPLASLRLTPSERARVRARLGS